MTNPQIAERPSVCGTEPFGIFVNHYQDHHNGEYITFDANTHQPVMQ